MEPGLSSTLARSDCLADSRREYTNRKNISSGNFSENGLIRASLELNLQIEGHKNATVKPLPPSR